MSTKLYSSCTEAAHHNFRDGIFLSSNGAKGDAYVYQKNRPSMFRYMSEPSLVTMLSCFTLLHNTRYGICFFSRSSIRFSWLLTRETSFASSKCLASLELVPLHEHTILDILSGKREENSIKPEEVRAYDKPGAYTLLGRSANCHPERSDLLFRLLDNIMGFRVEQYPGRYMTKAYPQAVGKSGDMLVQHLFMAPRPDLAPNAYEIH